MHTRTVRLALSLVGLSIFALLTLDFLPGPWANDIKYADSIFSYVIMGLIFYVAVNFLGLPSLEYFGLPRFHFKTGLALLIALLFAIQSVTTSDNVHMKPWVAFRGVLYLIAIGFGEEMLSRAFTFGALFKFGRVKAVFFSSLLFGLLHLNLYIGSAWDPWVAYWHVMETFAFGVFICMLMIVTQSIWVAVIFHGLSDWSIIFDNAVKETGKSDLWHPSFWEGITSPIFTMALMFGGAMLLMWIDRGSVPRWMKRLALKWKLVEPGFKLTA